MSMSVNLVVDWTRSKCSQLQSEMQILPTFAAKRALFPPSGFKLFEDANVVPSSLIMKLEGHLRPGSRDRVRACFSLL